MCSIRQSSLAVRQVIFRPAHVSFRHLHHSFTIAVPRALYECARSSGKTALVPAGIGDAWFAGYYTAFTSDPALVPFYRILLSELQNIRSSQNFDDDAYLE